MRKRSEVAPQVQTAPSPATSAPTMAWQPPENVFVSDGIVFIKCGCGIKLSYKSAIATTPTPVCISCGADLDPKRELTQDRMEMLARTSPTAIKTHEKTTAAETPVAKKEETNETCAHCGMRLTITSLGKFYPCGHDKKAPPTPAPQVAPETPAPTVHTTAPVSVHVHSTGMKFRVVYGEMTFSPVQYMSFRVGPFEAEGTVQPDETLEQAMKRTHDQLAAFARIEFDRKGREFAASLEKLRK